MSKLRLITSFFALLLLNSVVQADSLWSTDAQSIYTTVRSPKVGDIILVQVSNQSSAIQQAGTNTSKRATVGADFYDLWDQYGVGGDANDSHRKMQNYRIGGNDSYTGMGKTTRESKVKADISAVVTEILANGNLVIVGEHTVNVNDETQLIRVSGIVRPQDISPQNTVLSNQVAQVQISVKGDGVVGSKQTPGFLTKMFNWVF